MNHSDCDEQGEKCGIRHIKVIGDHIPPPIGVPCAFTVGVTIFPLGSVLRARFGRKWLEVEPFLKDCTRTVIFTFRCRRGGGLCVLSLGNDVLPKVVIIGFIFMSVVSLLILRNRGNTTVLLSLESRKKKKEKEIIPYLDVQQFKSIQFISDKSKYNMVMTLKWILVVVQGPS
jgi:hypothetical protein